MTIVIAETMDHHSLLRDLRTLYPADHYFYYLYVYFVCFVCLFVCLYPINVKTAEPIGPKFSVGPRLLGRFMEHQNLKKKILENKNLPIHLKMICLLKKGCEAP